MIPAVVVDAEAPLEPDRSFAEFFAAGYERALRLATLLQVDPASAEDTVCDAFARTYGKWRAGRVADVDAYVRQAIVNEVRGGWRRRVVERRHAGALERQAIDDAHAPGFERRVVERDEVWTALRRLPPGQRRVVVLRCYEDLDEREVARLLGVNIGTVKSQAAKGLAALHTILRGMQ